MLRRPDKEFQALFGLWGHNWMRARHDKAKSQASQLIAMAEPAKDPKRLIVAHRCMGSTLFTFGDFRQARQHLERAIKFGDMLKVVESAQAYAVDPTIAAQLMLAWDLWFLGYPAQAAAQVGAALKRAIVEGDPYSIAFAQYVTSVVHYLCGDSKKSLKHARISLGMSLEYRINLYALYSRFGQGCALAELGRTEEAIREIKEGIEEAQRSDLGYMRAFMLGCLANVQHRIGNRQIAQNTLANAFKYVDDISGRAWEAELYRLQGDLLNSEEHDFSNEIEPAYRRSIAVARGQGARSLELRSSTSLARALLDRHRREEADDVVRSIYSSFDEGHQTADLTRARQLLAELQLRRPLQAVRVRKVKPSQRRGA
jgi:tetratricopeptide (TPR) repeat protein